MNHIKSKFITKKKKQICKRIQNSDNAITMLEDVKAVGVANLECRDQFKLLPPSFLSLFFVLFPILFYSRFLLPFLLGWMLKI